MSEQGRWILNRGALRNPCEGCKGIILKGAFYWRDSNGLHYCRECLPDVLFCLVEPCTWDSDDCPFQSCPRKK